MPKRTINLILDKESDSPAIRRAKLILPILASLCLILFVIIFMVSLNYTKNNLNIFKNLKSEVDTLEAEIESYKNIEGIYSITYKLLEVIQSVVKNDKSFSRILSEINFLNSEDLSVINASADNQGNINLTLIASSSAALNKMVYILQNKEEEEKIFSQIEASGIIKNKSGDYNLNLTFKVAPTVYESSQ